MILFIKLAMLHSDPVVQQLLQLFLLEREHQICITTIDNPCNRHFRNYIIRKTLIETTLTIKFCAVINSISIKPYKAHRDFG